VLSEFVWQAICRRNALVRAQTQGIQGRAVHAIARVANFYVIGATGFEAGRALEKCEAFAMLLGAVRGWSPQCAPNAQTGLAPGFDLEWLGLAVGLVDAFMEHGLEQRH